MNILIIEDNIKLANNIRSVLEVEKYEIDVANDGQSGLDLIKNNGFYLSHYIQASITSYLDWSFTQLIIF